MAIHFGVRAKRTSLIRPTEYPERRSLRASSPRLGETRAGVTKGRRFNMLLSRIFLAAKVHALARRDDIIQKAREVVRLEVDVSGKRLRLLERVLRGMIVVV